MAMRLRHLIRTVTIAVAATATLFASTITATQDTATPRVIAIADIHGAGDAFVGILQAAGLVDAGQHWSGGTATFVQTGDYFDRGPGVRRVLDLLMAIEPEAKRAGGRTEILLGNHEVMPVFHYISSNQNG